jgi:hypothetical protein
MSQTRSNLKDIPTLDYVPEGAIPVLDYVPEGAILVEEEKAPEVFSSLPKNAVRVSLKTSLPKEKYASLVDRLAVQASENINLFDLPEIKTPQAPLSKEETAAGFEPAGQGTQIDKESPEYKKRLALYLGSLFKRADKEEGELIQETRKKLGVSDDIWAEAGRELQEFQEEQALAETFAKKDSGAIPRFFTSAGLYSMEFLKGALNLTGKAVETLGEKGGYQPEKHIVSSGKFLQEQASAIGEAQELWSPGPILSEGLDAEIKKLAEVAGSSVGYMAPSVLFGGMMGPGIGSAMAATSGFSVGANETYERWVSIGGDPELGLLASIPAGVLYAVVEQQQFKGLKKGSFARETIYNASRSKAMNLLAEGLDLGVDLISTSLKEGLEEVEQELIVEGFGTQFKDKSPKETQQILLDNFLGGAFMGGFFKSVGLAVDKIKDAKTIKQLSGVIGESQDITKEIFVKTKEDVKEKEAGDFIQTFGENYELVTQKPFGTASRTQVETLLKEAQAQAQEEIKLEKRSKEELEQKDNEEISKAKEKRKGEILVELESHKEITAELAEKLPSLEKIKTSELLELLSPEGQERFLSGKLDPGQKVERLLDLKMKNAQAFQMPELVTALSNLPGILPDSLAGNSPEIIALRKKRIFQMAQNAKSKIEEVSLEKLPESSRTKGKILESFAESLGRKIVWVDEKALGKGKSPGLGFFLAHDAGFVFVNASKASIDFKPTETGFVDSLHAVVLHEIVHSLEVSHKDVYKKLAKVLKSFNLKTEGKFFENLTADYGIDTEKELVTTGLDRIGSNPALWARLETAGIAKQVKEIFKGVLEQIKAAVKKLKRTFKAQKEELKQVEDALFSELSLVAAETTRDTRWGVEPQKPNIPKPRNVLGLTPRQTKEVIDKIKQEDFTTREKLELWGLGLIQTSAELQKFGSGRLALELLAAHASKTLSFQAPLFMELDRVKLKAKDVKWFREVDEFGVSNGQQLVDGYLKAPSKNLQAFADFAQRTGNLLGLRAEQQRLYRRNRSWIESYVQPEKAKLMRSWTELGVWILEHPGSDLYERMLTQILEHPVNKAKKIERLDLEREIKKLHEGMKSSGQVRALEFTRKIPVMPSAVKDKNGKWRYVLNVNPNTLVRSAIHQQTSRLMMVETAGQGMIPMPGIAKLKAVARALGLKISLDLDGRKRKLILAGLDIKEVESLGMNEVNERLKALGLPMQVTSEEIISKILELKDLSLVKEADLKLALKKFGGVSKDLIDRAFASEKIKPEKVQLPSKKLSPGEAAAWLKEQEEKTKALEGSRAQAQKELLEEIKLRLSEDTTDVMDFLRQAYQREGGNVETFDLVQNLAQGMYFKPIKSPVLRGLRFFSSMLGSFHVSFAGVVNLPQTFALVPTICGTKRWGLATLKILTPGLRGKVEKKGLELGAFDILDFRGSWQKGQRLEEIARMFRKTLSTITLLRPFSHNNNLIAAEAGRMMAEDWKSEGLGENEEWVARFLRLTEKEISEARTPGGLSPLAYAKVVQNSVSRTQFITEQTYNLGKLEINPILREIFPYQSYSAGTLRTTADLMLNAKNAFKDVLKGGSPKMLGLHISVLLKTLAQFTSAGMVGMFLRSALMYQTLPGEDKEDEETWLAWLWEKALRGFWEAQFFGPITRTLAFVDPESSSPEAAAFSLMPKVNGFFDAITLLANLSFKAIGMDAPWGKARELRASTQINRFAKRHAGAWRALANNLEAWAYPRYKEWKEARALGYDYLEKTQSRKPQKGDYVISGDKFYIREALARGDFDQAKLETLRYFSAGGDAKSLGQSLKTIRPFDMSDEDLWKLLETLPLEKRLKLWYFQQEFETQIQSLRALGV